MTVTAYLGLGSNLGDREANLRAAIAALAAALGPVIQTSSFWETEPMEVTDQPWFLNAVIGLATAQPPAAVLEIALDIERSLGRVRSRAKGPRLIDIDLLLYGMQQLAGPAMIIPHPAMHLRRFVLAPLAEIAPDAIHPVFMRSAAALLAGLPPTAGAVRRWPGG